jgi:tungstate transport system permease protein
VNDLGAAFVEAIRMIVSADLDVTSALSASLRFSFSSTLLASSIGLPAGVALAHSRVRFRHILEGVLNTLLALPTVIVGLFVYTLICSQGPLGRFRLLFSPAAIILGQTVLIIPTVAALACGAIAMVNPVVRETALTLGAGRARAALTVASEAQAALLVACITAFGRVIGEVGISLLLGGNILGYTRTITTAIALQTSKGEFALGLALGMVLLCVAFAVNISVRLLGARTE